jgi:hypothetical protein
MNKLRFWWFIVAVAGIVGLGIGMAHAATVYANLGPLSLPVPWESMNAVYLYNETDKVSEVGGEVVLAQLKAGSYQGNPIDIDFTGGGVLDPSGNNVGTAYGGINLWLPNPIPVISVLSTIQPGLFGGYEVSQHKWVFGLKAAIPIFK